MTATTTSSWAITAELAHKAERDADANRWQAEQERNVARVERAVARLQLDVRPIVYGLPGGNVRAVLPAQTEVADEYGVAHEVALVTREGTSQLTVQVRRPEDGRPAGPWLDHGPLGTLADLGAALVCDLTDLEPAQQRAPSTAELLHQVLEALVRDVVTDELGRRT